MKLKIANFKDIDNLFIEYKGYTISFSLKQFEYNNNLGIEIETEKEKLDFIEVLKVFQKELERLEF
jgi:hypothetical protein